MKDAILQTLLSEASSFGSFAHQWDSLNDRVLLISLSAENIRAAAFLDQRILNQSTVGAWAQWPDFERVAAALPRGFPGMIFHVGHCGSTLISRLLEEATGAQGLREPLILRSLATEMEDAASGDSAYGIDQLRLRLNLFLRSCARDSGKAIVKASSMCGDLAAAHLRLCDQSRSAFIYVRPEAYVAAMLGGENNRTDLYGFAKLRRRRLARRGIATSPLSDLSPGEIACLCWMAEACSFVEASAAGDQRMVKIDFDTFLEKAEESLDLLCRHFGNSPDPARLKSALAGSIMKSYSKAPQFAFDPNMRASVMAEYSNVYRNEIKKGIALLGKLAASSPAAAAALNQLG